MHDASKMPKEYLWGVNGSDEMTPIRLHFIHVAWLVLSIVLGVSGLLQGVDKIVLALGFLLTALPAFAGIVCLPTNSPLDARLTAPLLVISWTMLAVVAVAGTGAPASPATILFAIAPLIALHLDQPRMAAEGAIFGVVAYLAIAIMLRAGLLPPAQADGPLQFLSMLLAFAGLMLVGLLTFSHVARRTAQVPDNTVREVREPALPSLPINAGLALIELSPEGRIRRLTGDTFGLASLKPGAVFNDCVKGEVPSIPEGVPPLPVRRETELSNGTQVDMFTDPFERGSIIILRDLSGTQGDTETALQEADDRLKQRTAFFAALGHDLKTPLNAILGYADMMRLGIRGPMPDAYADYPQIIHESGQDLMLLVEDILDLAKADADRLKLDLEPVELGASAHSVIRQLQNQADRAGVRLRLKADTEVWAEADARAVRQIWQNLVSNAIKYSDAGGVVTLEAHSVGSTAVLRVVDKGAGMSSEDVRQVLQPFSQGANARGRSGTGLGLAVVKSFAELHGGQVSIDSALGKGTQVEVTLPGADVSDIEPLEDAAE